MKESAGSHCIIHREHCDRLLDQEESRRLRMTGALSGSEKRLGVEGWSYDLNMADKGPFLTSCIIFYLSIGAAIFQILEEPNWKSARDKYTLQKENILKSYPCLDKDGLENILKVELLFLFVCLFTVTLHLTALIKLLVKPFVFPCRSRVSFYLRCRGEAAGTNMPGQLRTSFSCWRDTHACSCAERHIENAQMSLLLLCCLTKRVLGLIWV